VTTTEWAPPAAADLEPEVVTTRFASFDAAYAALAPVAYRAAYRLVGEREAAQDIAQDAMVRLVPRWRKVAEHPCPEAWAATVATRIAINAWRRRGRAPRPEPGSALAAEDAVVSRDALVRALRSLPRRQRDVAVLLYIADLPVAEVAAALGCSDGTVKTHASRAREALRGALA
jgi:RNA polymerase sigma-70 factor (sigma-E family)